MGNDTPGIGHNNPPEPTPFELSQEEIDSAFDEAKGWLDGEPIVNQGQADAVAKLLGMLREAFDRADERRKKENEPFDAGKAAVQAKYAPLIANTKTAKGKAVLAMEGCKNALAPWLDKLDREKKAAAEAARKAAEEQQRAAQEAMRAAQAANDLAAREQAEALVVQARKADATANRAENDKAQAKGGKRAVSLRTYYRAEVTDHLAFGKWAWKHRPDAYKAMLDSIAAEQVAAGLHDLPGVKVHEDRRAA